VASRYARPSDEEGRRIAREVETTGAGGDSQATDHPDNWTGSRHVVQVRPHVWNWLAPRIGGGEVLEIGPGLRPTAPVRTSTFVDASSHALDRLAARGGRTVAAGTSFPFPDASFDAVLAFEVVEHVEADTDLIGEIGRVTRPDGVLILSTPVHASMWTELDAACGHVRRDEPDVLFGKIRAAGFEIGGYQWWPPESRALTKLRARALRSNRQLSTAFVQTMIFPIHATYQRIFGRVDWKASTVPVSPEADHVMLWATRSDGAAPA
jgi:SAM-dependent methyltransferase